MLFFGIVPKCNLSLNSQTVIMIKHATYVAFTVHHFSNIEPWHLPCLSFLLLLCISHIVYNLFNVDLSLFIKFKSKFRCYININHLHGFELNVTSIFLILLWNENSLKSNLSALLSYFCMNWIWVYMYDMNFRIYRCLYQYWCIGLLSVCSLECRFSVLL